MLNRKVDLAFPIETPGGTVTSVTARPLTTAEYELALTGPEGRVEAFSGCIGLPAGVAVQMDDVDYDRVARAIARLNRRAAKEALAERYMAFTLIPGGKHDLT